MDKIDIKLITLLQENARYPLKFLASQVFLSAPAVSSRINKLEKQGIILGYNTVIDRETSALWKYIDTNCFFNTCSKQRN